MRVLGGKWKGSILWHLKDEPVRFNDLTRMVGGASKKMINQRLKEMEKGGLVRREILNVRPIAVAYQATEFGRSVLLTIVRKMMHANPLNNVRETEDQRSKFTIVLFWFLGSD
jgi:DNA-binding HxlR family transcriptional regulator